MAVRSLPEVTTERIARLRAYMEREVLRHGDFVCTSAGACSGSLSAGLEFWEGQLSHLGRHFDLELDDRAIRVMVVGKENGRGPGRITLEQRYEAVHDFRSSQPFSKRNPHMRGTTLALRVLLTGDIGTDPDGEYITDNAGARFHLFDAFALVNRILCSAVAPNSTDGRSTPTMRRNCLRHFDATVRVLQPTVMILQGASMPSWIRPCVTSLESLGPALSRCRVAGVDVLLAQFAHPQARGPLTWSSPSDTYARQVVVPTLQDIRARLGLPATPVTRQARIQKHHATSPADVPTHVPDGRWAVEGAELQRFLEWVSSTSTSTPDGDEMRIAFVLARELGLHPTRTIRILRGQRGEKNLAVRDRVELAVASTPELTFVMDRSVRRVAFAEADPSSRPAL